MKKSTPSPINAEVMKQIKSGKVHMKPRAYYTLLGVFSLGAALLAGLVTAYLASIVFLWLRIQTIDRPAFGARANLSELIAEFPWWAVALAVALLAVAIVIVRRYGHMYKHRISTIALVLVTSSLVLGLIFSLAGIGTVHMPSQPGGRGAGPTWQRTR